MAITRLLVSIFLLCTCTVSAQAFSFGQDIDQDIHNAARHYQVSEAMLRGLVKMEDGWYGKRSPTGALGVGQFTQKTWNWLAQSTRGKMLGMRLITPLNRGTKSDPRRHHRTNTYATALLARWHLEQFALRGIKPTDEHLYLAHNIGLEGLHRALLGRANAEDIRNMRRNGMRKGMSVAQFLAYQGQRYRLHKHIANNRIHLNEQNYAWVSPKSAVQNQAIFWVEPQGTSLVWVEPK
ncbi:hypothetical protein EGB40_05545 [Pasteurella multocida]|uniref:hypothetical protein n=1 Tax=Pasteurella multocida TaxID=747 RepID=UPI001093C724|nr:hypothetical protein [Pasteurella multocida]NAT88784.1 hypothetical protein [Pasteurella multocida]QCA35466.1 hypothetical protein E5135_04845 [Pasteurella multocida]HDX1107957.1 hypothetical protein [Pasteurella multocida]HDX1131576.1 hypothetical protein [Pasteurella multocida]HDX1150358.1 hypothetical protein [Pasteurella multocida]